MLMQARILQPLLVTVSLGYLHRLEEIGIVPDYVLGHSLGEVTALAASGVVTYEQAIEIAAKRGELMDQAASRCNGGMLAVMFVPLTIVEELLEEIDAPEKIVLANDNAPDQAVLSGDMEELDRFAHILTERKLGKSRKVLVAGPWHSPFMKSAKEQFEQWVEPLKFIRPNWPVILNATAHEEIHPTTIKHLLTRQLTSPVFWRESMNTIHLHGADMLFEIGPGRVLSGLARVNGFKRETAIFNINNLRGIELAGTRIALN